MRLLTHLFKGRISRDSNHHSIHSLIHSRQHLDFRDLLLADVTAVAVPPRPEDPWDLYGRLVGKYTNRLDAMG